MTYPTHTMPEMTERNAQRAEGLFVGIAAAFVLAVSVYAIATPDQSAGHRAAPRMEAVQ